MTSLFRHLREEKEAPEHIDAIDRDYETRTKGNLLTALGISLIFLAFVYLSDYWPFVHLHR